MEKDREEEIRFFETELDLCHALLDIAGSKPLTNLIAKAQLGYENVMLWVGTLRDPVKLVRINAKLDRLWQRLSSSFPSVSSQATLVGVHSGA